MYTTTVPSPFHHERLSPAKFISAARPITAVSPSASDSDRHRRALCSMPTSQSAHVPASSLINRPVLEGRTSVESITRDVGGEKHTTVDGRTVTRPSQKLISSVRKTSAAKRGAMKKTTVKSAEFILDSDDSDEQVEIKSTRTRVATAITADASPSPASIGVALKERSPCFSTAAVRAPDHAAGSASYALPRRRSWTPLEDTVSREMDNDTTAMGSPALGATFAALVGNFSLNNAESKDQQNAQPSVKTRKHAAPEAPREYKARARKRKETKASESKIAKARNQPKATKVKKRPQTITALATAPYLPQDLTSVQVTMSEVLAATNLGIVPPVVENAMEAKTMTKKRKSTTGDCSTKVKKVRKPTEPRTKRTAQNEVPRILLPPIQAQGSLINQTFIFGTSSQLPVEQLPETLNQIQLALQESEASPRSAHAFSPTGGSCTRVPTAPHGTLLSIGQANRDLWCVSARDDSGGMLVGDAEDSQDSRIDSVHELASRSPIRHENLDLPGCEQVENNRTCTKPPSEGECRTALPAERPLPEDSFVIISSGGTPAEDLDAMPLKQVFAKSTHNECHAYIASPMGSQPPWPSAQRQVLQPLDANLGVRPPTVDKSKQTRATTSSTQPAITNEDVGQPKRRGRPPKSAQELPSAAHVIQISSSPVALLRHEGKTTSPSKILATLQSSPPSEWHNIDEISDSETPPTPSPPRRRLDGPPVREQALELAGQDSVEDGDSIPVSAPNRPSKDGESQWTNVLARLYPRITSTIRSSPPSNSLTQPTWHEKILLYDPIVIEDLTAWLNARGLRVTVRRSKPKARKKNPVAEIEVFEEELSHWMVQKWCEEHSICCLWKEGLRGGVRTRY